MSISRRMGTLGVPRLAPWTAMVLAAGAISSSVVVSVPNVHRAPAPPTASSSVLGLQIQSDSVALKELSVIEAATKASAATPETLRSLLDRLLKLGPTLSPAMQARVHALAARLVKEIAAAVGKAARSVPAAPARPTGPVPTVSPTTSPVPSATPAPSPSSDGVPSPGMPSSGPSF